VLKLVHYARCTDVKFFRLGTSGGLGEDRLIVMLPVTDSVAPPDGRCDHTAESTHGLPAQAAVKISRSIRFTLLLLVCSCLFQALPDCALRAFDGLRRDTDTYGSLEIPTEHAMDNCS